MRFLGWFCIAVALWLCFLGCGSSRLPLGPARVCDARCSSHELPAWNPEWSDGCSAGVLLLDPSGVPWVSRFQVRTCCNKHDASYYVGGTEKDRESADQALCRCLQAGGMPPETSQTFHLGVQKFGGPEYGLHGVSWAFGPDGDPCFCYQEK